MQVLKEYMLQNKFAKIDELETLMDVSKATVRRCLLLLESEGFLHTARGGAVLNSDGILFEQPYYIKRDTHVEEKIRIAKKACELVGDDMSIFLDSSTTVTQMCPFLHKQKNLMVATNDIQIALELKDHTNVSVVVAGGVLRRNFCTLTGMYTEMMLKEMNFEYAFISSDVVNEQGDMMITNLEEVQAKRIVTKSSAKIVALCDHSKFEGSSFVKVCGLSDVSTIITGRELPKHIYEHYREMGLDILLA